MADGANPDPGRPATKSNPSHPDVAPAPRSEPEPEPETKPARKARRQPKK